ncbi:PREDICTED: E3 ubiquitin-protein ligase ATL41-like [Nelumbo nucifera]|uniref:RING-type E3 ubiquitin transferase n=1 Tax=Nelumbo nucifera TaxID=4432 RepID=A0A1U8BCW0_NELNU|nr:PREDICTED: E3 ubiquitin-protein ligase ATL41-like [Nelumbo nucifera]
MSATTSQNDVGHQNYYPYNYQMGMNGKIMLTAIISLLVVVALVVLLHIYARCILRRQARRQAILRRVNMSVAAQPYTREPPKRGLGQSVIDSLPTFAYKQIDPLNDSTTTECAVCLSILEGGEKVRLLPNCKHLFHVDCIDMWLDSHSTCPICRTDAEPQPKPDQSGESSSVAASAVAVPPSAPAMDTLNSITTCSDGTPDSSAQASKVGASTSRLSSFRRMLSRERSDRRIQPCEQADGVEDLERQ